ncbi:MAG TPA: diphosphomevalonate decarboxylase [Brevefilum fermentans]|nr:diphosphomevalonate decarboxylase [Brevefilum fermentans]
MNMHATALAHPNIAFIKFWGLADEPRRIPANGSLSMNIDGLTTRTRVEFDPTLAADELLINGQPVFGNGLERVQTFMDRIRRLAAKKLYAHISSENNFPIGAGLASSASGFAALALAGTAALGLTLSERELSALARFGSGSACRSIPAGFVEWTVDPATSETDAHSIAPVDHWDLVDCIAILSHAHKPVGSQEGMRSAPSSPLQAARVADAERRLKLCRQAILERDFAVLAEITELDCNLMHAVMMTSTPPLYYWEPGSLAIIQAVKAWQAEGLSVTFTLDAGPNVHLITTRGSMDEVTHRLRRFPEVIDVVCGGPAGPARLVEQVSPSRTAQV